MVTTESANNICKNFLTTIPAGYTLYKGRKYRVNPAYDAVLVIQQLFRDDEVSESDKVRQALKILVKDRIKVWCLNPADRLGLLKAIYGGHIDVIPKHSLPPSGKKTVDFLLDGEYIYASFRQAYGIDLIDMQGRLPWKKFLALFEGLPDSTKIKEIMRIRGSDLPEPTSYNAKYRESMMQMKLYYALPADGKSSAGGVNQLFSTLERMAQHD